MVWARQEVTALGMVASDNRCSAPPGAIYTECPGNHRHAFSDPEREGRLLAGWATLHPKPVLSGVWFTEWKFGEVGSE